MISSYIGLLLLIVFSCWRDWGSLREGGVLSRWAFGSVMVVSFGILIYVTWSPQVFYPTEWLGRVLQPLLPFDHHH
ncbi:hypothetical protein [Paenibacillus barengoltzii]|jgi:hypothetical protein|uniref:Uncharacterized protein n=2 Tax=Paenibacillus barengoltzii TaxID=343517 RepID=R9L589_9BACL|nr:hypothetical protein [Paenibacillus barengoltzii]EOS53954.1 hypothetical protein C812_03842 [Paenibacillus barengoltzii G22]SME93803.1 hypothetical protein SAMN02744124_00298 [Paenibacillus barengoltzii J12]